MYRKTISTGALPNATVKTVAHGITGLGTVIGIYGSATSTAGARLPLPYQTDGSNINVLIGSSSQNSITLNTSTDRSDYKVSYITIEYTKT